MAEAIIAVNPVRDESLQNSQVRQMKTVSRGHIELYVDRTLGCGSNFT